MEDLLKKLIADEDLRKKYMAELGIDLNDLEKIVADADSLKGNFTVV